LNHLKKDPAPAGAGKQAFLWDPDYYFSCTGTHSRYPGWFSFSFSAVSLPDAPQHPIRQTRLLRLQPPRALSIMPAIS
jgi:hypothetical protein